MSFRKKAVSWNPLSSSLDVVPSYKLCSFISVDTEEIDEAAMALLRDHPEGSDRPWTWTEPLFLYISAPKLCEGCGCRYQEGDMENCEQCAEQANVLCGGGKFWINHCHGCSGEKLTNSLSALMYRLVDFKGLPQDIKDEIPSTDAAVSVRVKGKGKENGEK